MMLQMEKSQQDNEPKPHIQVLDIEKNDDGTTNLSFEVNDEFIELIKTEKNKERT